jgi:glycosyltransferase
MPAISVITVSFNASASIRMCLDSVASQSVDLEHIIVDGQSTDNTVEILQKYRGNPRLRIISEPDKGIYDAMNKGIGLARGEIIGFLNADDQYATPGALSRVLDAFCDPATDSCYGDLIYVDKTNPRQIVRYWCSGLYNRRGFYFGWMPPHPTF